MKISLTGAQSTGKTTLLNKLKHQESLRYSYEFIDEITRRMLKKGLKINENGNNLTQILIINEHLKNQLYSNVIMDRCLVDGVVYTEWLWRKGNVSDWVYNYAVSAFREYKDNYDIIYYLKPEFEIEDDGVRSIDVEFQTEIAEIFEKYIHQLNCKVVPLSGTVEERLTVINSNF